MNSFSFTGNLGRDAVVRHTQGGDAVAGFSVAAKAGYGDNAQTIWVDCSIWGKRAESKLVDFLKKGTLVGVTGELGTREYEGKTYITCRVSELTLLGKSDNAMPTTAPSQQPAGESIIDDDVPF